MIPLPASVEINSLHTAFEVCHPLGYAFPGESHNFWEMVCVLDGRARITADSRVLLLEKNQVIFHKPMEFHKISTAGDTPLHAMIFSFLAEHVPATPGAVYSMNEETLASLQTIFSLCQEGIFLQDTIVCGGIRSERAARLLAQEMGLFILKVTGESAQAEQEVQVPGAKNYTLIVNTLEAYLQGTPTLSDIAAACGMSVSAVKKTFHKYAGIGVMNYLNDLKMQRAAVLLSTGESVKNTAATFGFSDQSYFSSVFRRHFGCSPSSYTHHTEAEIVK